MRSGDDRLARVRARAAAVERARIARELHDGIIQTVMGVQIQLAALSTRAADESPGVAGELKRLEGILKQEAVGLRQLMRRLKPSDLDPDRLVDALGDVIEAFERETGIATRFVTDVDRVPLSPQACREVTRILQEALVNVRKHSGARRVSVDFATLDGCCVLSIVDDGRGFPFSGRLSQDDLEDAGEGPSVIQQRVRLLGGELTVQSDPGQGARLEIAVPLASHGIYG
jgi:signal transduction histidine kinase